jgi:gliding motility-associated-like protein
MKKLLLKKSTRIYVFNGLLFFLFIFNNTYSQSWTGATSRDWNVGSNWSSGTVPGINDYVQIGNNVPRFPMLTSNVTISGLRVLNDQNCTVAGNVILNVNNFNLKVGYFKSPTSATGVFQLENCDNGSGGQIDFLVSCTGACPNGKFEINGVVSGNKTADDLNSNVDVSFNIYNNCTTCIPYFRVKKIDKNLTIAGMGSTDPCYVFAGFNYDATGYGQPPFGNAGYINWNLNQGQCTVLGDFFLINRTDKMLNVGWMGFNLANNFYLSNTGGGSIRTSEVSGQTMIRVKPNKVIAIPSTETLPQTGIIRLMTIYQTGVAQALNMDLTTCPAGCSMAPSGNAMLSMSGNTFTGPVFIKTPNINFAPMRDPLAGYVYYGGYDNNVFLSTFNLIKTGSQNDFLAGGNQFYGAVNVTNTGSGNLSFSSPTTQSTICGISICTSTCKPLGDVSEYDNQMPGDSYSGNISVTQTCGAGAVNLVSSSVSSTTISGDLFLKLSQNTTISGGIKFTGTASQNITVNDGCNTNAILSISTVQPALSSGNLVLNYISGLSNPTKLFIFDKATIFTSGKIDANNNFIQLNGAGGAHTGNPSSYIIVNSISGVRRSIPSSANPQIFPIGNSSNYYPFSSQNANNASPITVSLSTGVSTGYTGLTASGSNISNSFINFVWLVNSSVAGHNAQVLGGWMNNSTLTGFSPSVSARMARNAGTSWNCIASNASVTGSNPSFVQNYSTASVSSIPGVFSVLSDDVFAGNPQTICGVNPFNKVTLSATAFAGGTWSGISLPSPVTFSGITNPNATVTGLDADGVYTFRWSSTGYCGASAYSDVNITKIGSGLAVKVTYSTPFCNTSGTANPTFSPSSLSGGTFTSTSGISLNTSTGVINLPSSNMGVYNFNYTVSIAGCGTVTTTTSVTINSVPGISLSYPPTICATSSPISPTLSGVSGGFYNTTATSFTLNTTSGVISFTNSLSGSFAISYNKSVPGCGMITSVTSFMINSVPGITVSYPTGLCSYSSPISPTLSGVSGGFYNTTSTSFSLNTTSGVISFTNSLSGTFTISYNKSIVGCGMVSSSTGLVVNAIPTVIGTNVAICSLTGTTLTVSGATSYLWQPGGLSGSSNSFTPSNTTIYSITGTNVAGCTATGFITITVNSLPDPSGTSLSPLPVNNNRTLIGSGGHTWSTISGVGGSISGNTYTAPNISGSVTIRYTNTVTGCFSDISFPIGACPSISTSASPVFCAYGSQTRNLTGSNGHVWSVVGVGNLSGASTYQAGSTAGTANIYFINTFSGCITNIQVTVSGIPSVASNSTTICSGLTANLSATGANTYTWQPGAFSGQNYNPTVSINTIFTVTGANAFGCTSTGFSTVNTDTPPNAGMIGGSNRICITNGLILSVSGTSGSLQWNQRISGSPSFSLISGETNNTLSLTSLSTTTSFNVTASNGVCTPVTSSNYDVIVDDISQVGSLVVNGSNPICYNTSSSLSISSSNGTIKWLNSTDNSTFNTISGANTSTYTTPLLTDTIYYKVEIVNGVCPAIESISATVNVFAASDGGSISSVATLPICTGTGTSLDVLGNMGIIQWETFNGSTWVSASGSSTSSTYNTPNLLTNTQYRVTATNGSGCTFASSSPFTVTTQACSLTADFTIDFTQICITNASSTGITFTNNSSVVAPLSITGYSWDFGTGATPQSSSSNASITPTYATSGTKTINLTVTGNDGSIRTSTKQIEITDQNTIENIIPTTGSICVGSSTNLSVNGVNNIQWYVSSDNGVSFSSISGAVSETYSVPSNLLVQNYQYKATSSGGFCPTVTTSSAMILTINPIVSIGTIAGRNNLCNGENITLNLSTVNGTNYGWLRSYNGSSFTATGINNILDFTETSVTGSIYYRATVDGLSCGITQSSIYTLSPIPCDVDANFSTSASNYCILTSSSTGIDIENSTTGTSITGYSWDFGADATPSSSTTNNNVPINVKYTSAGTKNIGLTATGVGGVISTETKNITITEITKFTDIVATKSAICIGDTAKLNITVTGGIASWYNKILIGSSFEDLSISGSTLSQIPSKNTEYLVIAGNGICPTVTTPSITINVQNLPTGSISGPDSICSNSQGSILFTGSNNNKIWQKQLGENWINIDSTNTNNYRVATFSGTANFRALISGQPSCPDVPTNSINVKYVRGSEGGNAVAALKDICVETNTSISLTNNYGKITWQVSEDSTFASPNINDGGNPTLNSAIYTTPYQYEASLKYFFRAMVTQGNCPTEYSNIVRVKVCDKSDFIPNALTPFSNDQNSYWDLTRLKLNDGAFIRIYNRYGVEVAYLEAKKIRETPWDGGNLPAGTYYFVLNKSDNSAPITGALTIVK